MQIVTLAEQSLPHFVLRGRAKLRRNENLASEPATLPRRFVGDAQRCGERRYFDGL